MTSIGQNYSRLDDPTVDRNTGYTNRFLTERNNLFPEGLPQGAEYSRVAERPPDCDHVYSNIKDLECTPLMRKFMSRVNVDHLQQAMIDLVAQRSQGRFKITRQSDDELLIIMRAMFLQYARNLPTDLDGQVQELNRQVLLFAIPVILSRIEGYIGYRYDQRTPNKFMSYARDARANRRMTFTGDFSSRMI